MGKPLKIFVVLLLLIGAIAGTFFGTKSIATNVKITVDDSVQKEAVYLVAKSKANDDIDVWKLKYLSLNDELKVADADTTVVVCPKDYELPNGFTGIAIDGVKKLDNGNYIVTGDVHIRQYVEGKLNIIAPKPADTIETVTE